jgi:hypothetical protein
MAETKINIERVVENENTNTYGWECKMVQPLENSSTVSQKVKHKTSVWANNSTQEIWKEDLYRTVCSSIIHNSENNLSIK